MSERPICLVSKHLLIYQTPLKSQCSSTLNMTLRETQQRLQSGTVVLPPQQNPVQGFYVTLLERLLTNINRLMKFISCTQSSLPHLDMLKIYTKRKKVHTS